MAGGGGTEPNLTPFIDLFSVMICFLLMTAAWVQLESLQVKIEEKPKLNPDMTAEQPPPPEPPEKKIELSVRIEKSRLVMKQDQDEREFRLQGQDIPEEFRRTLEGLRPRLPASQVLVLHSGNQATYGQLIRLYDVVTHSGWANVAINPY